MSRVVAKLFLALPLLVSGNTALAQICDQPYTVKAGDNLYSLAEKVYGDEEKWPLIFYPNKNEIGSSPSFLKPSIEIRIPCLAKDRDSQPDAPPEPEGTRRTDVELRLLTGDAYQPYTDRGLDRHGMATAIVTEALNTINDAPEFGVFWVNKWAVHLKPLLVSTAFDMGFPWLKPNCEQKDILAEADKFRCTNFYFSEPLTNLLVRFYARTDGSFEYESDEDLQGKKLCRPEGYYTFDLDQNGRYWLANNVIELVTPPSPKECFQMLVEEEVDLVSLNYYLATRTIRENGWSRQVEELQHEDLESFETLHVLISKDHPKAGEYLRLVNEGIDNLNQQGKLHSIEMDFLQDHLGDIDDTGGIVVE